MVTPHVEYVAHHWILLAVPAFLPAVILVGVVLYVALKDRRAGNGKGKSGTPGQQRGSADEKRD